MSILDEFYTFIAEKPSDEPVCHSTFNTCAVGDFLVEVYGIEREGCTLTAQFSELEEQLNEHDPLVYDLLNEADIDGREGDDISTYGLLNCAIVVIRLGELEDA